MRLAPLLLVSLAAASCASTGSRSSGDDATHFAKLKALAGSWKQKGAPPEGHPPANVTYAVTAGGSAVVETEFGGTPMEMVTVYTLDQGHLNLTHYCMLGNQPKMELQSVEGNTLEFNLTSLGNGDPSKDMHMHHAKITLVDGSHLNSAWTLWDGGKKSDTHGFELVRASN